MKKLGSVACLVALAACAEVPRGATDAYVRVPDGPLDCPAIRIGLIFCPATLHDHVAECGCAGAMPRPVVHYLCRGGDWQPVDGTCPPLSASHR